jgi:phosphohistidine phosphatase
MTMELLLVRHAKAADGHLYEADEERPLTADGRRAAREVGEALAKAKVLLDAIWTSPLVRAVETAELVAVSIGFQGGLSVSPLLAPEGRPHHIIDHLIARAGVQRAAFVGHEPSMGKLLSALLGKPGLSMSKGAAVKLEWDGKKARLIFALKPKRLEPSSSLDAI